MSTTMENPTHEWSFELQADLNSLSGDDSSEVLAGLLGLAGDHDVVHLVNEELHNSAVKLTVKVKAKPTGESHAIRPQDRWEVLVLWNK